MRWASLHYTPGAEQVSPRRRVVALGFVIAVHILLLLMLLTLAPPLSPPKVQKQPSTFELMPDRAESPAPAKAKKAEEASAARPKRVTPPVPKLPVPKVAPPVLPPDPNSTALPGVIPLTREELAAADIAKMPSRDQGDADGEAKGSASAGGAGKGKGKGPGGADLYPVDWYPAPTRAELAYYLPKSFPLPAWGRIICRTAPNNRVEDCREAGQHPPASGLASALRQAAWQFHIVPPRLNGRPLIGVWVALTYDFLDGDKK